MRNIRQIFCHGFFLLSLLFSSGSFADIAVFGDGGPRWACWYSPASLSVNCLLTGIPANGNEMRAAEVNRTIDRRLPALVRTIWGSPEKLAGEGISIPLMTTPYEMELVKLLAKSVMCGRRPDCSVTFDPNRDGMAPVRAAALEAGASEAEVMAGVMLEERDRSNAEHVSASPIPRMAKQRRGTLNI